MSTPVYKAGLILLQGRRVCLVQVKAKHAGEQDKVDFGLPKGTRRYRDEQGTLVDARDAAMAQQHRESLEPLTATLRHEMEAEIGLPAHAFVQGTTRELGVRPFTSRKGERYDIGWYIMDATETILAAMRPSPPEAHQVKWFSIEEVRALSAHHKINPCYVAVLEEVLG